MTTRDTKIGIVGMGVVGKAVYNGFSPVYRDFTFCDATIGCLEDMNDREFVFICVPSDQVEDVVCCVAAGAKCAGTDQVIIVKSTVLPGTCRVLARKYECTIVHNPEFLTDRSADLDFINANRIVLGSTCPLGVERVEELYRRRFRYTPIIKGTSHSTEFAKYMINLYFMTKITFMNEMKDSCVGAGASWDKVLEIFTTDGRITPSHIDVPGHDGIRGFGGKCFPENIENYIQWADSMDIDDDLVKKVKELNDLYRP